MPYHRRRFLAFVIVVFFCSLLAPSALRAGSYQARPPELPGQVENLRYDQACTQTMYFLESDAVISRRVMKGERWRYECSLGVSQEERVQALSQWFSSRGWTVASTVPYSFVGCLEKDGLHYNACYDIRREKVSCSVVLERVLSPGTSLSIEMGGDGRKKCNLRSKHDGAFYRRLLVDYQEGSFYVDRRSDHSLGKLERSTRYNKVCSSNHGGHHELLDLPQYADDYEWTVSLESEQAQTVTLSLVELGSIPSLPPGDALGALRLRNLPFGSARVEAEWKTRFRHPSFDKTALQCDRTPQGDAIFWMPPGFWTVTGLPPADAPITAAVAHMVPVQPGRMTVVDWPRSLSRMMAPKGTGRLEVLGAKAEGEKARVDISMLDLDADAQPTVEETSVYEGAEPGTVLSVERIQTPLDIVLLLDSSGSMKGSMRQAIAATKRFIERLPRTAKITVIDFDTAPKPIKAADRTRLLGALDSVIARGATCLYDAIILGLKTLDNAQRPALVVFTDGVDANWNDTAPGSTATKPQVMAKVKASKTPIFTIGFGKKPDTDTLGRIAALSGGAYYQALDDKALTQVFSTIEANLGRQYRICYGRPRKASPCDTPVMALVVDNSGSMDRGPRTKGCDFRIEGVRQILSGFTHALPENFLIQLLAFNEDTHMPQVLTSSRAPVVRGISTMKGLGGTNILGSLTAGFKSLEGIPSTRRYLVYLADAAMKVDRKWQGQLDVLLRTIADSNINALFVGVVDSDEDGAFAHAAKLSKGRSIISSDLEKVKATFTELAQTIRTQQHDEKRTALSVSISHRDERGRNSFLAGKGLFELPALPPGDSQDRPEALSYSFGEPLVCYDETVGSTIAGPKARLEAAVRVSKRLPLDVEGRNEAMSIEASEMIFLSKLQGIAAPNRQRFCVIPLKLDNLLKSQKVAVYPDGSKHPAQWVGKSQSNVRYVEQRPPYLIPDLTRHMHLTFNEVRSFAISPLTWLCAEPLVLPGKRALSVAPDVELSGAACFLVPDEEMTQSSLHFFDINYGHIHMPLVGCMPQQRSDLPTSAPKKLGNAFTLALDGFTDLPRIDDIGAEDTFLWRSLNGRFGSKVQALLAIKPQERFFYQLPSHRGNLLFELHDITQRMPRGFHQPTMLAPGSSNAISLGFRIPAVLAKGAHKGELFCDIKGGGVHIAVPAQDGTTAPMATPALNTPSFSCQGVDVYVHEAGPLKKRLRCKSGNLFAIEVSLYDRGDSNHTRIGPLLVLKQKALAAKNEEEYGAKMKQALWDSATKTHRSLGDFGQTGVAGTRATEATGIARPEKLSSKLLFALDETSVVFDGQWRRGVLVFELPKDAKPAEWSVGSLLDPEATAPLTSNVYDNAVLLSERLDVKDPGDAGFWQKVRKKVAQLQAQRHSQAAKRPGHVSARSATFETSDLGKTHVPVPASIAPQAQCLSSISSLDSLLARLKTLEWLPGRTDAWSPRYCSPALLTQGWGTPCCMAQLAEEWFNLRGITTIRREATLTPEGLAKLKELSGLSDLALRSVPVLSYKNTGEQSQQYLVFPFLKPLSAVQNLVTLLDRLPSERREQCSIRVYLRCESTESNAAASTRMAATALAGGSASKEKRFTVLEKRLFLDEASLDALDIGYREVPSDKGPRLAAILDGPDGREFGREKIDLKAWTVVAEEIHVEMAGRNSQVIKRPVSADWPIQARFHSISLNAPDLPAQRVQQLEDLRRTEHSAARGPDSLSSLRWYTRSILDRFIAAQTAYESQLAKSLKLTIGRTNRGRRLMVSVQRTADATKTRTYMDLLDPHNFVHKTAIPDFEKAKRTFTILSGIAAARFEAAVIPGGKAMGVFELWDELPENTPLAYIDSYNRQAFLELITQHEYPTHIIERIKETRGAILIPARPAVIDDEARFAWLEFDRRSFEPTARLGTGERGAMIEHLIGDIYNQASSYFVGALVGIDAALWSVSAFSLQLEDYDEICEKAKKFAVGMAKNFKVGQGPASCGVGGSPDIEMGKLGRFTKFSLDFKGVKASNDMLGFGNGYKDAVQWYFEQ